MGNIQSKLAARANHAEPIEMTHRSSGSADASAVDHIEASAQQASAKEANAGSIEVIPVAVEDVEAGPHTGESKKLIGRNQFTVLLTVEAIALGTLGVPRAFADLGMIGGVILTPLFGLISLYTAKLVGQVKLKYPHITNFPQAVQLFWKGFGYPVTSFMFIASLILLTGGHALAGTIAFNKIVNEPGVCALSWSLLAFLFLWLGALPSRFKHFMWLGYIDCASVLLAIFTVIVAAAVDASKTPGGLGAVDWSWYPADKPFYQIFTSMMTIVFAYSFTICQFAMMDEMHTPEDYLYGIRWLVGIEITIYTITGILTFLFVGSAVQSPALLSANPIAVRVAFGLALPVIYISGSINTIVVGKYIQDGITKLAETNVVFARLKSFQTSYRHVFWTNLMFIITLIAWVIAEGVPIFEALLGLISSLFVSGFSFYFPGLFWFCLLKEGKWNERWRNTCLSILNASLILIGIAVLGVGAYSSAYTIMHQYATGDVRGAFTCDAAAYS